MKLLQCFLTQLLILALLSLPFGISAQPGGLDSILIDFGTVLSPSPWHNVTDARAGGIAELTTTKGFSTGYAITVIDSFNGVNTSGTTMPDAALGLPSEASGDSFFGNTSVFGGQIQATGGVALTGLDPTVDYTLTIFASRTASDNRETQYVFQGNSLDTGYINVASNTDQVVQSTLTPDANGTIQITASPGPNNTNSSGFFYLGALIMSYPEQAPTGGRELVLTNPNGGELLQIGKMYDIKWRASNIPSVTLEYSSNGGSSWLPIATVPPLPPIYMWDVPNVITDEALVRISADTLEDQSEAPFTIINDTTTCTIVVIGSSTAQGAGASHPDSAWVNRFRGYLTSATTRFEVINLARGGYNSFHLLPTGSTRGTSVGVQVDTARNITAALAYDPVAIIINLPSNDAARFFSAETQLENFRIVDSVATANDARVYVATTQPRNFDNPGQVALQREVRDSIFEIYGDRSIDFWNGIADTSGFIRDSLDSGDGVHLNDSGHRLLFQRVIDKQLDTLRCGIVSAVNESAVDAAAYGVRVYPNPTSTGAVTIDLGTFAPAGRVRVTWVDGMGRVLVGGVDVLADEEGLVGVDLPGEVKPGLVYGILQDAAGGELVQVGVWVE